MGYTTDGESFAHFWDGPRRRAAVLAAPLASQARAGLIPNKARPSPWAPPRACPECMYARSLGVLASPRVTGRQGGQVEGHDQEAQHGSERGREEGGDEGRCGGGH